MHVANDGVCLMYESNYKKLLTKCLKCRLVNDEIKEMKDGIIQARFKMYCLSGCERSWSTQPDLKPVLIYYKITWFSSLGVISI